MRYNAISRSSCLKASPKYLDSFAHALSLVLLCDATLLQVLNVSILTILDECIAGCTAMLPILGSCGSSSSISVLRPVYRQHQRGSIQRVQHHKTDGQGRGLAGDAHQQARE